MKVKVKQGKDLLFMPGNHWDNLKTCLIINFHDRWIFNKNPIFKQWKNKIFIYTDKGNVELVFTGEVPKLEFDYYCKDQLVLKIVK
jgi:hypothetical protein